MQYVTAPRLAALALALAALAGCSDGDSGAGTGEDGKAGTAEGTTMVTEPAEKAPAGFAPIDSPAGFTTVEGDGYTLSVPKGFVKEERTSSTGAPLVVLTPQDLGTDSVSRGSGPLVGVSRDPAARVGALEQSLALEDAKRLVDQATNVRRTVLAWPGARQAVLVDWTVRKQVDASSTATRAVRTVQLLLDSDGGLSLSVVVVAPADSFDESEVATALRTFRPTATS